MSKYNQIRQKQMREYKPDLEKLITIASLIRRTHHLIVQREPYLLFTKDTCRLVRIKEDITKWEYDHHITHNPDLIFYINNTLYILELDGWIHDVKNKVIEKDKMRNEHYTLAGINYIIIKESTLLYNQNVFKYRSATADELWPTINKKIISLLPV